MADSSETSPASHARRVMTMNESPVATTFCVEVAAEADRLSRHTVHVATHPSHPSHPAPPDRRSLAELTVRAAHGDLLEIEPLDLGPGAPATIALERERGPQPDDAAERGDP